MKHTEKLLLASSLLAAAPSLQAVGASKGEKPNFVIIMADDMGYGDIECFGHPTIQTPNLNRMAQNGMRFTDYHSNGALSSPTRAALMTGRYQQRAGIQGVLLVPMKEHLKCGLQLEETTFAEALKEQGYATALFGKWHLGRIPKYNPSKQGFDQFKGFLGGNVDYKAYLNSIGENDWWSDTMLEPGDGYLTENITRHGVRFIEKNAKKPFVLYLAHGCPHDPYQGPDDKPVRTLGERGVVYPEGIDKEATYKIMIENLDKCIGEVLDALKRKGIDKNTFVFFCSDNGPTGPGSTGGLNGKKGMLYEGGHRVPAIAYWPGKIRPGSVCNQTAIAMDLFPTMLSLAGVKNYTGKKLDGVDISPLLFGKKIADRPLFWRIKEAKAVRSGDWKLVEQQNKNGQWKTELFNLKDDLGEKKDLSSTYPDKVAKLRNLLTDWEADIERDCIHQVD